MALRHGGHAGGADLVERAAGQLTGAQPHGARRRSDGSADAEHEARLAGPVGAQHRGHLTGDEVEAHTVHDLAGAAHHPQALDRQAVTTVGRPARHLGALHVAGHQPGASPR
jgi:hypothetical protein